MQSSLFPANEYLLGAGVSVDKNQAEMNVQYFLNKTAMRLRVLNRTEIFEWE